MNIRRNVLVAIAALACLAPAAAFATIDAFTQDFEALDAASLTALGDDGWIVYGNVYERLRDLGGIQVACAACLDLLHRSPLACKPGGIVISLQVTGNDRALDFTFERLQCLFEKVGLS